jgi:hypothetical protein
MSTLRSQVHDPLGIGVLGGIVYAAAVLSWMFSRGVYLSPGDPIAVVTGVGYSVGGLVLVAGVPLYLLTRFSLLLPAGLTVWFLGDTVYQELYGAHLHPLTSYLIVWPLLFGIALATGVVEALIRVATERTFGWGGIRSLV